MDSKPKKHLVHLKLTRLSILGLVLAVISPWIIVALMTFHRSTIKMPKDIAETSKSDDTARLHQDVEAGSWGFLDIIRITIQPPSSLIDPNIDIQLYRQWIFKNTSLENIQQLLRQSGLSEGDIQTLSKSANSKPEIKGFILTPPDELVRTMTPQVRALLYTKLSLDLDNVAQAVPFRFCGSSIYEWFDHSEVRAEIVEKIKPLIYQRGKYLLFSDLHLVLGDMSTAQERIQLLRALHRASTLRIRVRANNNADSVLTYWSQGNRRDEIEPLMVTLADKSQDVSIAVLLPTFARSRLYTYDLTATKHGMRDCHWSSFNFFNDTPLDRVANNGSLPEIISREYGAIQNPSLLGDIILVMNGSDCIHSCTYIAGDVVFTKNGMGEGDPFILEKLDDILDLYKQQYGSLSLRFIRRKTFQ